jgi:23S rRNA (guanosine2251-2'-O)-methyltransferase
MRERNSDHRHPGRHARRDERRPFGDKPTAGRRAGKAVPWRGPPRDRDGAVVLYGWHTVKAALENPKRRFHRLLATENAVRRLTEDGVTFPIAPTLARPEDIAAIAGATAVHQGLYAEADPLASPELEDVATGGIVVVLDQITDPHNFGAILRSAAAFAVTAVVTTERHSPQATGVLAKAASGALEYVPIVTVVNLARALDELRDLNTFLVGLDSGGDADLAAIPLSAPLALVIGAEGKGLRHLTRVRCDVVARLALPGRITSVNVSNAAALALYVASKKLAAPT